MTRTHHLLAVAAILLTTLIRCSLTPTIAGGGSSTETTNGFSVVIVYPDGTPVSHVAVRLRTSDYLADTVGSGKSSTSRIDALTDDSGKCSIDSVAMGSYFIEAADAMGNATLIACTTGNGDSMRYLGIHTVRPMGIIAGAIIDIPQALVRIRGIERSVKTDSMGRFETRVPNGFVYRVNITAADTVVDIPTSQPVQSSQTLVISLDPGNRKTDSLAIRTFLDAMGMGAVPVDSVTSDTAPGRIRMLNLSRRGLTVLPSAVGNLSFLWSLNVSNNPITDLPLTLDRIPLLTALNLDSTRITTLPSVVTRCIYLQWLLLSGTGLRDLPPEIAQLTILNELWMKDDSLTSVPSVIFTLQSLKSLSLSNNKLTQLPPAIGDLRSLQYLHVDVNQLVSLPQELTSLIYLKNLFVYQNNLTALPDSIGRLTELILLDVQSNKLTTLPLTIGQCAQVRYLHLFNNLLTTLPASIVNLQLVDKLTLGWNHLCALPAPVAAWADTFAETTWLADQTCP